MSNQPSVREAVSLKGCPFCGADGEEVGLQDHSRGCDPKGAWNVCCYVCHVETALEDTEAEAIEAWNRRADPLVEKLRGALSWAVQELEDWDAYQKQPERGSYDAECACCMGEMFDAESRARLEEAREALALPDVSSPDDVGLGRGHD